MSEDRSVQLDGDKLGERVGDGGLPGIGDYPPDTAMGVDDPNLVAPDDVATREARTRGEELPDGVEDRAVGDLAPPDGDRPGMDAEAQLLGDSERAHEDGSPTPAEVAAVNETE